MNDKTFDSIEDCGEPLGYNHLILCDVNIEYSPGGQREHSGSNKYCFKLKCLPYLMVNHHHPHQLARNNSFDSSICDNQSSQDDETASPDILCPIDVTRTTCAFLGNSDYVPRHQFGRKRVILELISAKLSQPTAFNVPVNDQFNRSQHHQTSSTISATIDNSPFRQPSNHIIVGNTTPVVASSKRFVNYTLLIKTAPGLDKYPAVIERRFSDFLHLYQGLKSRDSFSKIVDKHVTFPKKVYMGNFSLTNIAERSIEFSNLLSLCMTNNDIRWSTPFVSFLIDKELKEAHRLSLVGDPDDIQAFIETAHRILQKLYIDGLLKLSAQESPCSSLVLDASPNEGSPPSTLPSNQPIMINESSPDETNSGLSSCSNSVSSQQANGLNNSRSGGDVKARNQSASGSDDNSLVVASPTKASPCGLNQRILVAFCILFLTYYRGKNFRELKLVVREFSHLISSQGFVDSVANTRHFTTLRACLLFLMNMNEGNVIDENCRLLLKRKLEDIDGAQSNYNYLHSVENNNDSLISNSNRKNKRNGIDASDAVSCNSVVYRVTKRDLSSLLRDRNFCSFQEINLNH